MSKRFGETFDDLYSMKEQMDKLFRTSLERLGSEGGHEPGRWFPPMDMYDDGPDYVLEVEVPGVKQQDLEVLMLPDAIRLKGKRDFFGDVEQEKVFRLERPSGSFDRKIRFPGKVDTDHVQATLADGILTLRVPKADIERKKTVTIKKAAVDHG
jgi:HSP20 family protein